jgi:SAM-dependent methyltransferase
MADLNYVKEYFSEHATKWLAGAYGNGVLPQKYPVGTQRVRLAMEAIATRIGAKGTLVDLGCGGGELCVHAAGLGMNATGIDIAPGMIAEAEKKLEFLPKAFQSRLKFVAGDLFGNKLPSKEYDCAVALGLLEYLPEDDRFFAETFRLLKPGGVLVVSCRNRLFNFASFNDYTKHELNSNHASALLSELSSHLEAASLNLLADFLSKLKSQLPLLEEALANDLKTKESSGLRKDAVIFNQDRRQHTPRQLQESAQAAGFVQPEFIGVHPHPLPPILERSAPCFYNQFGAAFEAFEKSSVSLVWSSAFIGVFSKPD